VAIISKIGENVIQNGECCSLVSVSDKLFAATSAFDIIIYKIENFKSFTNNKILKGHSNWVQQLTNCGSDKLLSCSLDKLCKLWCAQTSECLRTFSGHSDTVHSILLLDGNRFLSGSSEMKLWNIENGECLQTTPTDLSKSILKITKFTENKILVVGLSKAIEVYSC